MPSLACVRMEQRDLSRPGVGYYPRSVTLKTSLFDQCAPAAERELRRRARDDVDKCCGYFPALAGTDGIVSDLPASRMFASEIPQIIHDGCVYHFNFLRVSLVQQGSEPEFHLDSDAATALTGDAETLLQRYVLRMVLNLSATSDRTLQYLDVDPESVGLVARGGYVSVARTEPLTERGLTAVIPPRRGGSVHGLVFVSNSLLHSGVDDVFGHFIAAYGMETDTLGRAASEDGA